MAAALAVVAFGASGCSTAKYLIQASTGQLALLNRARPIEDVLKDERTPPRTRALLARISEIKRFGESNSLKPTSNYQDYVKLDRPMAVWVVSACEPLRFESREWRFPIVGSFPYLGWFDLKDAKEFGEEIRKEGLDVDVRGANAYSTLGWFRDSVLSSMIPEGDEALGDLVNVVLHESVHATYYVKGQAYFNESIASYVADRLTYQFLDSRQGPQSPEKIAYEKAEKEGETRRTRLHETYQKLSELYSSGKTDAEKLAAKSEILSRIKEELGFKREINNATLIQFKTYHSGDKEFDAVYRACGSSWPRFWAAMASVTEESFQKGQQEDLAPVLGALIQSACTPPK